MPAGKLLRENAVLLIGTLLPVVVVGLFLLGRYVPRVLVDPPQYDFLLAQDYGYSQPQSRWRHEIDLDAESKLRVRVFPIDPKKYAFSARLFLYDHLSDRVREIVFPRPETTEVAEDGVLVEVPEFSDQVIDSNTVAPDGYEPVKSRRGRGPLSLFHRSGRNFAISKNGRVVPVMAPGSHFTLSNCRFVGWIVTPPE